MDSRFKRYGIAVVMTGLAWAVDLLLQDYLNESSTALFITAAMISAWVGGFGPGFSVVVMTAALNLVFYNHPYLSLAVGVHGIERLIIFSVGGCLVSWLTARVHRSERLLFEANQELEKQVRKRTAALTESKAQLEAFCYTLAHDLKSPLRSIQGFASLLLTEHGPALSGDGRACVERMKNSAERMGRLIVDLLSYTDLTRETFRRQAIDLDDVCRDVLRMFADEIERTHARISLDLSRGQVIGDRQAVERTFVNLLANALKFSDRQRAPDIRIVTEARTPVVRVWVQDNGIGIDPRFDQRIFGVFQQLTPPSSTTGTGIGLAIVKRSVEKMGGRVGVESEPGVGSRFWFELPEAGRSNDKIPAATVKD
jgi:signal transduction histidine kinase